LENSKHAAERPRGSTADPVFKSLSIAADGGKTMMMMMRANFFFLTRNNCARGNPQAPGPPWKDPLASAGRSFVQQPLPILGLALYF
jgi:hypothetical protein